MENTVEHLQAQLTAIQRQYSELCAVITHTEWTPTERVAGAVLRIETHKRAPQGSVVVFDDFTEQRAADLIGISRPTAGDALRKIERAKLIERYTETEWVNRFGQTIPRKKASLDRGDRPQAVSITISPTFWPAELPELADTPRAQRDRRNAKDFRNKALEAFKRLAEMDCPECGAKGDHWRLTCTECGATWRADDLAEGANPAWQDSCQADNRAVLDPDPEPQPEPQVKNLSVSVPSDKTLVWQGGSTEGGQVVMASLLSVSQDDQADPITGSETIDYLADLGAQFCFVEPGGKAPINPRTDDGDELSWPDTPITAQAAKIHLARGGNVGLLTGRNQIVVIDVDNHLPELFERYPFMATWPRFSRQNAPDRAKLLVFVRGDDMPASHKYAGNGHTIELLGAGHQAVIAGVHQSGATIEFIPGVIDELQYATLTILCEEWTATTDKPRGDFRTPAALAVATVKSAGDLLRSAIHWWNTQPGNLAEIERLLRQCPHKGRYVSIRPDDRTPSTAMSCDSYSQMVKPTWRDYGSNETLDAYELYCRLTGTDKRTHKWQIVDDYRAMLGKPSLRH